MDEKAGREAMNKFGLYDKALRVIESCTDAKHLQACEWFVTRVRGRLWVIGSKFCFLAANDLNNRMKAKQEELTPGIPEQVWEAHLAAKEREMLDKVYAESAANQMSTRPQEPAAARTKTPPSARL